jgi:formylglycine-generating enzyme required for sulfatase activity
VANTAPIATRSVQAEGGCCSPSRGGGSAAHTPSPAAVVTEPPSTKGMVLLRGGRLVSARGTAVRSNRPGRPSGCSGLVQRRAWLLRLGGTRLPTEAEWEFGASGGLARAAFPWSDELEPAGKHRMNVWQGRFPTENTLADGYYGTCPVDAFPPNGYGLYNVTGNVWEWTADWFHPTFRAHEPPDNPVGPLSGTHKVQKGRLVPVPRFVLPALPRCRTPGKRAGFRRGQPGPRLRRRRSSGVTDR